MRGFAFDFCVALLVVVVELLISWAYGLVPALDSTLVVAALNCPMPAIYQHNNPMTLSPRIRADYLLLINSPSPRQCLEAFATSQGVEWLSAFSNIVEKASMELPTLPQLLRSLDPDYVALYVGQFLDGEHSVAQSGTSFSVDDICTN